MVIWMNDPVDHPVCNTRAFREYFYQAYRGKIDVLHIPVRIHDRCLESGGTGPKLYMEDIQEYNETGDF